VYVGVGARIGSQKSWGKSSYTRIHILLGLFQRCQTFHPDQFVEECDSDWTLNVSKTCTPFFFLKERMIIIRNIQVMNMYLCTFGCEGEEK
jgi:hypothetical protein